MVSSPSLSSPSTSLLLLVFIQILQLHHPLSRYTEIEPLSHIKKQQKEITIPIPDSTPVTHRSSRCRYSSSERYYIFKDIKGIRKFDSFEEADKHISWTPYYIWKDMHNTYRAMHDILSVTWPFSSACQTFL